MTTKLARGPLGLPFHPRTGQQAVGFRKDGRAIWPIAGADGTQPVTQSPMVQRLYTERQGLVEFVQRTVEGANTANDGKGRDLSASENETLTNTRSRIQELDRQIKPLEEFDELAAAGNAAGRFLPAGQTAQGTAPGAVQSLGSARTAPVTNKYRSRGEVIVDQVRAMGLANGGMSDTEARDRLIESGIVFPGASDDQVRSARANAAVLGDQVRATQVTADHPGILPVPIIGEVMNDVDAARPFISSVGAKALNFAGETFKRPVVTQHTAIGKQTTQATSTGLGSQKMIIGSVTFTKETWGGWLDVARQDIDWTSPSAWNAILDDLTDQYGLTTENAAGDAFAAAVTATVEVAGTGAASTLKDWVTAMYAAAALAYAGAGRLPDTVWMSLDMWGTLGPLIESQVAMQKNVGDTEVSSFEGSLLRLPRYVVPSFPAGTVIIGAKRWTEVYEERIGLLQAVMPSVLGVQIAYGGYVAYNTLKPAAFAKVINAL